MPRIFGVKLTAYLPPAILWLMAVCFQLLAETFDLQSRTMPILIGRVMLLLATLDLISRTRTRWGKVLLKWLNPAGAAQDSTAHPSTYRSELAHILWIAVYVVGLIWLGVLVATPLFLMVSLTLLGKRTVKESIFVVFAVCGFVWILFTLVLHLHLFPGLLFGGEL